MIKNHYENNIKYSLDRFKGKYDERDMCEIRKFSEHHIVHEILRVIGFNSIIDSWIIKTNFEQLVETMNKQPKILSSMNIYGGVSTDKNNPRYFITAINYKIKKTYDIAVRHCTESQQLWLNTVCPYYELIFQNNWMKVVLGPKKIDSESEE